MEFFSLILIVLFAFRRKGTDSAVYYFFFNLSASQDDLCVEYSNHFRDLTFFDRWKKVPHVLLFFALVFNGHRCY